MFDPANDDIVEMGNLTFQVADQLPNSEVLIGWQTLKNHRIICRCTNSIASKIVAPLKKVLSYSQFKFARPNVLAEDKSETASVDDHTDTESVSSAVPSAQFPRQGTVVQSILVMLSISVDLLVRDISAKYSIILLIRMGNLKRRIP